MIDACAFLMKRHLWALQSKFHRRNLKPLSCFVVSLCRDCLVLGTLKAASLKTERATSLQLQPNPS